MELAKKISVPGINGIRGGFACNWQADKPESQVAFLAARIMGVASGVETKVTTYGDSLKFTGEFRAINAEGEMFAAPVAYLVTPADSLLRDAIQSNSGRPVEFAFDIFVQPTPKKNPGDRGYEYKVKPLQESKASDPLEKMMAALPAPAVKPKQPQLPGTEAATGEGAPSSATPAPTPEPTPAPTEAPGEGAPVSATPAPTPEPTPAPTEAPKVDEKSDKKNHGKK